MSIYRFPQIAESPDTSESQIAKIVEEVQEISDACSDMYLSQHINGKLSSEYDEFRKSYGIEILDVIHACETLLRMEFAEDEVEELRNKVISKNQMRGYYVVSK